MDADQRHDLVQVYGSADDCGHLWPYEPLAADFEHYPAAAEMHQEAFDEWEEGHPDGVALTEGGDSPGRICLDKPEQLICPACSEARYGEDWDAEGAYVEAKDCTVRPAVERALSGEVPDAG